MVTERKTPTPTPVAESSLQLASSQRQQHVVEGLGLRRTSLLVHEKNIIVKTSRVYLFKKILCSKSRADIDIVRTQTHDKELIRLLGMCKFSPKPSVCRGQEGNNRHPKMCAGDEEIHGYRARL